MSLTSLPLVGGQTRVTYKISDAGITDHDTGKFVKISATDTVSLCADGDAIYGVIDSVEVGTEDGKAVVGVVTAGRARVTLSGDVPVGSLVEAAAQTAAGVAKAGNWGSVSAHVLDTTDVASLAASTFSKNWVLISGAGTDGTDGTIESL